ncbi:hypothetical protein QTG54_011949 [Skeletonema marinoi]|uniref:Uncharacterized protein n=1 Tax=Skeletonema marinoi TaxID=267567 RepID=A0AAD9D7Q2_9STRA|nr:hypothetical protein QTG54_011949 [Skeletonema marinoi]
MVAGRVICFLAHLLTISIVCLSYALGFQTIAAQPGNANRKASASTTKLQMVRNIDLPEAIVFYGVESMMEYGSSGDEDDSSLMLRPGVVRLINECLDVGTAAILLSEEPDASEISARQLFLSACDLSLDATASSNIQKIIGGHDNQVLHFRTLNSHFVCPPASESEEESSDDQTDEEDESIEFYNLQSNGRSPSPAFLLDSLRSVIIDPRGFGGSSGFGRGQWVEPRRSPMTARTVVFIAGDWVSKNGNDVAEGEERSTVKDRCAASRAAGCRVIYLENLTSDENPPVSIEDDTDAMSLCDAVIDSFGNDNAREIQPVSLDAISTPGDYWLNPPNPRDDVGNGVAVDEIVEYFRTEREMEDALSDSSCIVADNDVADEEISEDEMAAILADLDAL